MDSGKADTSKLTGYSDNQFVVDDDVASGAYEGVIVFMDSILSTSPQDLEMVHTFNPFHSWVLHIEFGLSTIQSSSNIQEIFSVYRVSPQVYGLSLVAAGDLLRVGINTYPGGMSNNGMIVLDTLDLVLQAGKMVTFDCAYSEVTRHIRYSWGAGIKDYQIDFPSNYEFESTGINGVTIPIPSRIQYGVIYLSQGDS